MLLRTAGSTFTQDTDIDSLGFPCACINYSELSLGVQARVAADLSSVISVKSNSTQMLLIV